MRLPPIPPSALTAEQRSLFDDMRIGVSAKYGAPLTGVRLDFSDGNQRPKTGRPLTTLAKD